MHEEGGGVADERAGLEGHLPSLSVDWQRRQRPEEPGVRDDGMVVLHGLPDPSLCINGAPCCLCRTLLVERQAELPAEHSSTGAVNSRPLVSRVQSSSRHGSLSGERRGVHRIRSFP